MVEVSIMDEKKKAEIEARIRAEEEAKIRKEIEEKMKLEEKIRKQIEDEFKAKYSSSDINLDDYSGNAVKEDSVHVDTWQEYINKLNEGYRENEIELTDPAQMNSLGLRYERGEQVRKDIDKAIYWYKKAANLGEMYAQRNLGLCYSKGKGVPVDYD